MASVKIEIKSRWTGRILFEYEKEGNTVKDTVVEAVKSGAYLRDAYLRGAYLRGAYLCDANLCDANLSGAYLRGAYLCDAKELPDLPLACPSDGAFVAWKKVKREGIVFIVKLQVPEDARRSSATTNKCRCDKALVLDIYEIGNEDHHIDEILNTSQDADLLYKVGEMVYPDSFDENRWEECSHGIHFFINKQDAINY